MNYNHTKLKRARQTTGHVNLSSRFSYYMRASIAVLIAGDMPTFYDSESPR